ncbi:Hypothetical predicted protein [Paramuricea clavata]|uniref:Uncharacterized protein n=1 Tax=Paramuricea clavata TaxID=317549 RepID=A0A7D9JP64_PARCT|nr:Hypothetical predicted protein [Paramuricea clavata]
MDLKLIAKRDNLDLPGGVISSTVFINEYGIYDLVLGSRLPAAKEFKWWVISDVLPSIRKTRKYALSGAMPAIDNVKDDELRQLSCSEHPEARCKLVHKSNIVKDPGAILRGKKGGLAAQEKIRETRKTARERGMKILELEAERDELEEEVDERDERICRLKEENERLTEKVTNLLTENERLWLENKKLMKE